MSPRIVDKEEKRRQILMAAMQVFGRNGVENTRMIDIANEAGIGKGTVYEYFRSRDHILRDCFYLIMDQMETHLSAVLAETHDPVGRIRALMTTAFDDLTSVTDEMMRMFIEFWSASVHGQAENAEIAIDLKPTYDRFRREIAVVLEEGIRIDQFRPMNCIAVASTMMAIMDGILLQLLLDRKTIDLPVTIREATDMILFGVLNHEHSGGKQ